MNDACQATTVKWKINESINCRKKHGETEEADVDVSWTTERQATSFTANKNHIIWCDWHLTDSWCNYSQTFYVTHLAITLATNKLQNHASYYKQEVVLVQIVLFIIVWSIIRLMTIYTNAMD